MPHSLAKALEAILSSLVVIIEAIPVIFLFYFKKINS